MQSLKTKTIPIKDRGSTYIVSPNRPPHATRISRVVRCINFTSQQPLYKIEPMLIWQRTPLPAKSLSRIGSGAIFVLVWNCRFAPGLYGDEEDPR